MHPSSSPAWSQGHKHQSTVHNTPCRLFLSSFCLSSSCPARDTTFPSKVPPRKSWMVEMKRNAAVPFSDKCCRVVADLFCRERAHSDCFLSFVSRPTFLPMLHDAQNREYNEVHWSAILSLSMAKRLPQTATNCRVVGHNVMQLPEEGRGPHSVVAVYFRLLRACSNTDEKGRSNWVGQFEERKTTAGKNEWQFVVDWLWCSFLFGHATHLPSQTVPSRSLLPFF